MANIMKLAFVVLAQAMLVSCTPSFNLSFYNNSGNTLTVLGANGEQFIWEKEQYLTFHNSRSNVITLDYPLIEFGLSSSEGTVLGYSIERYDSEDFRFVSSGGLHETQVAALVTKEPQHACVHLSIQADMKIYWAGNKCRKLDMSNFSYADQPDGFPISPEVQS